MLVSVKSQPPKTLSGISSNGRMSDLHSVDGSSTLPISTKLSIKLYGSDAPRSEQLPVKQSPVKVLGSSPNSPSILRCSIARTNAVGFDPMIGSSNPPISVLLRNSKTGITLGSDPSVVGPIPASSKLCQSSSGLGPSLVTRVTRIRIPLGSPTIRKEQC